MSYGSRYHHERSWWGYVKSFIRKYKYLKDNESLKGVEAREMEAVKQAMEDTRKLPDGEQRLKLVDIVFWKKTHTLEGAAMTLYISRRTAIRWHSDFIKLTAAKFGLDD